MSVRDKGKGVYNFWYEKELWIKSFRQNCLAEVRGCGGILYIFWTHYAAVLGRLISVFLIDCNFHVGYILGMETLQA